ncbi:FecR family protein [Steroidobacter sp.]|uniref:FecR family protein n=1 Tax=Steroidobacter sp. TaxID=1978227 RepID=UPI001A4E6A09|nr:FecR family protein [Steroidobacter sp.]MBL8271700.1 FecR family protein [Steroidobacter sp.]
MNDMLPNDYRNRIVEEAADWFARLQDSEVDVRTREAFAAWLTASPEHVHEYLALTALQSDIGDLPEPRSVDELIRLASEPADINVIVLRSALSPREATIEAALDADPARSPRRPWLWFGLAASVLLAVFIGVTWLRPGAAPLIYSTAVGEQKSFTLADGSVVTLNAVSRLEVKYSPEYRDIQLQSGEALFDVAKNPHRPFRVLTADSVIQAVGTRFNVRHREDDTTVTVLEGRVKVAAAATPPTAGAEVRTASGSTSWTPVAAGESAKLAGPGVIDVAAVDANLNTAWRERRLVFASRPLDEVVAEFNLYNPMPLTIRDPALHEVRISGAFYANDPNSFAMFLEAAGLARSQPQEHDILLLPAE